MISENAGKGERLDLLCGHFAIAPPHDRLLRDYLPPRLVVHAGEARRRRAADLGTAAQLTSLVSLMRSRSAADHLGGRAMLNALSTAMLRWCCGLPAKQTVHQSDYLRLPAIRGLRRRCSRCSTNRQKRGLCQSLRASATCHARRSPAIQEKLDDQPTISWPISG